MRHVFRQLRGRPRVLLQGLLDNVVVLGDVQEVVSSPQAMPHHVSHRDHGCPIPGVAALLTMRLELAVRSLDVDPTHG